MQLRNLPIYFRLVHRKFWENVSSLIWRVRLARLKGKQDTNLIAQILRYRCNIPEVKSECDWFISH